MFSRRHSHSGDVGIPVFWVSPMFWVFPCFGYPRILSISMFLVFPWFCYPCVFGTPVPKSLLFRVFPLGLRIPKTKRRELNSGLWQLTWRSRFTCRGFIISKGKDHRKVKCKMEDGAWPSGCDKSGRNLWNVFSFFFTWSAEICKPTFIYVFKAYQEKNWSALISIPWNPVCLSLYPRTW